MISLTLVLIIMTGLISYRAFSDPRMMNQMVFYPALMKQNGQWYRLLTSGFIHADFNHLLLNMFVFYQFGEFAESMSQVIFGEMFGRIAFVFFYLSAIVVANLPSYFRHQDDPTYRALGASGATSAMVFAYILFSPWNWFLFPPLPALLLGIGYLMYSSYMDKQGTDNIGHNAHFWGAMYGLAATAIAIQTMRPDLFDFILAQLLAGPSLPGFLQ